MGQLFLNLLEQQLDYFADGCTRWLLAWATSFLIGWSLLLHFLRPAWGLGRIL